MDFYLNYDVTIDIQILLKLSLFENVNNIKLTISSVIINKNAKFLTCFYVYLDSQKKN